MSIFKRNYLLVGFLLVMLLSLAVTVFLVYTGERMASRHSPLIDAAMEIKLNATLGHLWFEEILSGDSNEDIANVWSYLESADWYASVMLVGGENGKGVYRPLKDPALRAQIESVRAALREFETIARERYANFPGSEPGSQIDQEFDMVFADFMEDAEEVETHLHTRISNDLRDFRRTAVLMIALTFGISLMTAYILGRLERQRQRHVVAIEQANTEIRQAQAKLNYLAHFDGLTELPNRTLFLDRLEQAIAHAKRKSVCVVLLFIDLDKFKSVNDRLGHGSGDQVLNLAAHRLRKSVRSDDSVARLGGDEFTVILSDIDDQETATAAATAVSKTILKELSTPFSFNSNTAFLSASIGIAIYPQDGLEADELLLNADHAMFEAKAAGKGVFRFHSKEINERVKRQLRIENDLRDAIDQDELRIHYQPQWDMTNGKLAGMEALVRWQHPKEGLLQPGAFIPVAETSGLIDKIDMWVLKTACKQYRRWRDEGLKPGKLAVNISAMLFRRKDLVSIISANIAEYLIAEGELELELTESALLEDSAHTQELLEQLRRLGIQLAIDDFGTGYSSMAYLRSFPAKTLKIDQSFIKDIHTDKTANAILRSMVELAKSMQMDVVAEGIETTQQETFVRTVGCQYAQGYLLGRPIPADDLRTLMISQTDENVRLLPPNGNHS